MAETFQQLAIAHCDTDNLSALLDQRYELQRSWLSQQLEERARHLQSLVEQEVAKNAEAKFHRLHEVARQERHADMMLLRRSLNDLTSRVDGLGLQELRTELHDEVNGLQEQMKAIMLGFGETPDLSPQRMGRLSELLLADPKQDTLNEIRRDMETFRANITEFRADATHRLEALESEIKSRGSENHTMTHIYAIEAQMKHSADAISRVSDVLAASHGVTSDGQKDALQVPPEAPSIHSRLTSAECAIETLMQQFASISNGVSTANSNCEANAPRHGDDRSRSQRHSIFSFAPDEVDDANARLCFAGTGPAFATIDLGCLQGDLGVQPQTLPARSPVQSARTTPRCVVRMQRGSLPGPAYQVETAPSACNANIGQAMTVARPYLGTAASNRDSSRSLKSTHIGSSSMLVPAHRGNSATVPCKPAVTAQMGTRASRGPSRADGNEMAPRVHVSPQGRLPTASPPPHTRNTLDLSYAPNPNLA